VEGWVDLGIAVSVQPVPKDAYLSDFRERKVLSAARFEPEACYHLTAVTIVPLKRAYTSIEKANNKHVQQKCARKQQDLPYVGRKTTLSEVKDEFYVTFFVCQLDEKNITNQIEKILLENCLNCNNNPVPVTNSKLFCIIYVCVHFTK